MLHAPPTDNRQYQRGLTYDLFCLTSVTQEEPLLSHLQVTPSRGNQLICSQSWAGWRNSSCAAQRRETPSSAPGKAKHWAVFQAGHCGPGQQLCEVSRALGDSEVHRSHLGPAAAKASSTWGMRDVMIPPQLSTS